jgi:hypothetical protein
MLLPSRPRRFLCYVRLQVPLPMLVKLTASSRWILSDTTRSRPPSPRNHPSRPQSNPDHPTEISKHHTRSAAGQSRSEHISISYSATTRQDSKPSTPVPCHARNSSSIPHPNRTRSDFDPSIPYARTSPSIPHPNRAHRNHRSSQR